MRQSIIHPWVNLLVAAFMFWMAFVCGSFFAEGVTKKAVAVPIRSRFHSAPPQGVLTASRENHPKIYFGSLAVWGLGCAGACIGGIFSCLQAAYDRKWRKEGKTFQPQPRRRL
jgi:hypothetical protein